MEPQRLEKIEFAPGSGMVSEASNPQDLVHGRANDPGRLRLTSRKSDKVAARRDSPRKRLSYLMFSTRLFAESGRFGGIPCFFPC